MAKALRKQRCRWSQADGGPKRRGSAALDTLEGDSMTFLPKFSIVGLVGFVGCCRSFSHAPARAREPAGQTPQTPQPLHAPARFSLAPKARKTAAIFERAGRNFPTPPRLTPVFPKRATVAETTSAHHGLRGHMQMGYFNEHPSVPYFNPL